MDGRAGAVIVLAGVVLIYVFTSGPYGSEAVWSTGDGENPVDVRDGVAVACHLRG